jgi:anhydro-N-acetylmuramic acid kinase
MPGACAIAASPSIARRLRRDRAQRRTAAGALLAEPWLSLPPPKSTGRDLFHLGLAAGAHRRGGDHAGDVQATLAAFHRAQRSPMTCARTADLRARAGVRRRRATTRQLLRELSALLPGVVVESTAEKGLDPGLRRSDGLRLAGARVRGAAAGNSAAVTGARGPASARRPVPGAEPG